MKIKSVDLRSAYERTYNQGPDPACGPFACCAALDCIWARSTGQLHRFEPYYFWNWVRFYRGMLGTNTGSDYASLEKTVRLNGAVSNLVPAPIKGFKLERTTVQDARYLDLKHLLCMGYPVILEMKATDGLYALASQRDWRKHVISADTSVIRGQHYVCIVGYDDAAGRWLCENSWGPEWADGGFFGIPYGSLQSLTESLQHFNELPLNPKPIDGYMSTPVMFTAEKSAFVDRVQDRLQKLVVEAYSQSGSPQAVIGVCVEFGISDKHLEILMGWGRGTVRQFKQDNSSLNWAGFIWDQV